MRLIILLVALMLLGWSGWWWLARSAQITAIETLAKDRAAAGMRFDWQDLSVSGYPSRVDARLEGMRFGDPEAGWEWRAPEFQLLMLSYKPNHAVLVWPGTHVLMTGLGSQSAVAETARASVMLAPELGLGLDRAQAELADVALDGALGAGHIARADLAMQRLEPAPERFPYRVGLRIEDAQIPGIGKAAAEAGLPAVLDLIMLDGRIIYEAPLDRHALSGRSPRIAQIAVETAELRWGEVRLTAQGAVTADDAGHAAGKLELRLDNWQMLVKLGERSGVLPRGAAVQQGLGLLASLAGRKDLVLPLEFRDGTVRLGPLPLGRVAPIARPQ